MLRTGTKERLQRWVEHFSEILNRDDPTNPVEEDGIVESEDIKEIDLGRWERFDVSKLPSEEIKRKKNTEVRNSFGALRDVHDPEEEHDMIFATYRDGAKRVLGWSKKLSRPWTGSKTSEKIKERKEAKLTLEGTRSERLKQRRSEEYSATNNEVKWSAEEDKQLSSLTNYWLEKRAGAAEKAADNGRGKELYSITKSIPGERWKQEICDEEKQRVLSTD